jgi:hypothetical protein
VLNDTTYSAPLPRPNNDVNKNVSTKHETKKVMSTTKKNNAQKITSAKNITTSKKKSEPKKAKAIMKKKH